MTIHRRRTAAPALVKDARYEWQSFFKGSMLAYLVGLYLVCFYLELHFRYPILQAIRFQFTFGAILGVLCLIKVLSSRVRYPLTGLTKSALALIAFMGIYTLYTFDAETSARVYNDRVLKFAAVAFFIYAAVDKIEDLRVIILALFLVWLKLAQEGFWGWASGNLMWDNQGIARLHGSTMMFRHPNSLSGLAVSCLPFCYFFYHAFSNRLIRAAIMALVAGCLLMILVTGSRTGYVALVLCFVALVASLKHYRWHAALLGLIIAGASIFYAPSEYKERFESIFTGEERVGRSSDARLQIIDDAIKVAQTYPMGVGVGAFPKVREEMFGRVQDTHNLYLEVLTNIGVIGFIIFSIFIVQQIRCPLRALQLNSHSKLSAIDQKFIQATLLAVMGFIVARLFLGLFGMDMYEIYWWLAMGLTLACNKLIHLNALEPEIKPQRRFHRQ